MNLLDNIRTYYIANRLALVDKDFLEYEEDMSKKEDLEKILKLLDPKEGVVFGSVNTNIIANPHNSIILYIVGLTKEFDFDKSRSDLEGGTPADIDLDIDPRYREQVEEYLVEKYGRECVAHIGAYGDFHLQGIGKDIARISEPVEPKRSDFETQEDYNKVLVTYKKTRAKVWTDFEELDKIIPSPKFGLQPKYADMLENHPEVSAKWPEYNQLAEYADGMRKQFGVHAAGIVISDVPLTDHLPLWKNDTYTHITQFDKDEIEALGFLKIDLLVVDSLSVIDECLKLLAKSRDLKIDLVKDIYEKDGNERAYRVLNEGLLTGIWQMETSPNSKVLINGVKPTTIQHLSDISALNRPGPLQAGLDKLYIQHKRDGTFPDQPDIVNQVLVDTYGVLIYQEQVMALCVKLAGYTLIEADSIRKSIGKKKIEIVKKLKSEFTNRCVKKKTVDKETATKLFDDIIGFSAYAFNLAHACSYAHITYATAYLKANYPLEFFTALMTIKANGLSPKEWQEKVKEYMDELKFFNIAIVPPDINHSESNFYFKDKSIFFGLSGIKTVAKSSADAIVKARKDQPFTDIINFLSRINKSKVNTGKFEALVKAGCFDRMGYKREDLIENKDILYGYFRDLSDFKDRKKEFEEREIKRNKILEDRANGIKLEKLPMVLKLKTEPVIPVIERHKKIRISQTQLNEQAEYIGCYLGKHPSLMIQGNFIDINKLWIGEHSEIRCLIQSVKKIITKKGDEMAFVMLEDSTSKCDATIFPKLWNKYATQIKPGTLAKITVKVESEDPIKVIVEKIEVVGANQGEQ